MSIRLFKPSVPPRGGAGSVDPEKRRYFAWLRTRGSARVAAAVALVAIGSASTLGEGVLTAQVAAVSQRVDDLIAGRSPGRRVVTNWTKGKFAKGRSGLDNERFARALPRTRDPRFPGSPPLTGLGGPEEFLPDFVAPPEQVAGFFPGGFPPGGFFVPGPGGGFVFIPGGPGGGGGGGGCCVLPPEEPGPEPPVNPPPPAIPEPATWAMMVLGFGAAGYAIRRRRRDEPAIA